MSALRAGGVRCWRQLSALSLLPLDLLLSADWLHFLLAALPPSSSAAMRFVVRYRCALPDGVLRHDHALLGLLQRRVVLAAFTAGQYEASKHLLAHGFRLQLWPQREYARRQHVEALQRSCLRHARHARDLLELLGIISIGVLRLQVAPQDELLLELLHDAANVHCDLPLLLALLEPWCTWTAAHDWRPSAQLVQGAVEAVLALSALHCLHDGSGMPDALRERVRIALHSLLQQPDSFVLAARVGPLRDVVRGASCSEQLVWLRPTLSRLLDRPTLPARPHAARAPLRKHRTAGPPRAHQRKRS